MFFWLEACVRIETVPLALEDEVLTTGLPSGMQSLSADSKPVSALVLDPQTHGVRKSVFMFRVLLGAQSQYCFTWRCMVKTASVTGFLICRSWI